MFLALQIILALGNRPKAEKLTYTISIATFAFFSTYLVANTVLLTIKAFCPIGSLLAASDGNSIGVFLGSTYGPIFAGLAGTFGVYIVSVSVEKKVIAIRTNPACRAQSLLYLEPWHLLHSMIPFLLIAPSFTNILNVYAFCNLRKCSRVDRS